ncbi:hypothetical protein CTZ24_24465 (plasmid) [Pantoea phytobeneficialis]|uniref:Uncharacterized protein n=2 Tax=Pantoea phytobeneficialis TaxID=2052056 RepID=A0AAP9HAD9_9GAMM|nr:hypothetical protein CTZ24_24465 [Pantoea phytobeneficialis]
MTDIQQLILAARPLIPFRRIHDAQAFLSLWPLEDQFALISALCIGRDHMGANVIRAGYVSDDQSFDRFLHIGSTGIWLIPPADFAGMLCEAGASLEEWFTTFEHCATVSGYDLSEF